MKIPSIKYILTTALIGMIVSLTSCLYPPCPADEPLGTLTLSETALSFFPAYSTNRYVFEDDNGNERVWWVDYKTNYKNLTNELTCSNGKGEQAFNYYETEYRKLQYTSGQDRFTIMLGFDWGRNGNKQWEQDLPEEYLTVWREEDSNWSNSMLKADSASFKKLYLESISFRDRTFNEVFILEHIPEDLKIYYSVDTGIKVIIHDGVEWLIKEG